MSQSFYIDTYTEYLRYRNNFKEQLVLPSINKVTGRISNTERSLQKVDDVIKDVIKNKNLYWYVASGTKFTNSGRFVAYDGTGRWVAVGQDTNSQNTILTSTDGENWSTVSGTTFTNSGNSVAYGGGIWVAVGNDGGGPNTILTSTDGTNWSPVSGTTFTNSGNSVAYGGGRWIAVGNGTNNILTSPDG